MAAVDPAGDPVRLGGERAAGQLDEQDRRRPAIARVTRRLVAERGRPVLAGVELTGRCVRGGSLLAAPSWCAGCGEEGLDMPVRAFA